ncbi:fimbrillin family protein [Rikenella microfusus]|uniref:fimbrillin family protein n=4 Tax=Rikenella microfusus TaxID=28139 RepID=UPI001DF64B82|nr:fimbrillin family protein [Rikenella microfusus]HJE87473.1 fimbrillin family protein [Rikenella microfusus]
MMKHQVFLLAAVAAVAAGCTKSETVGNADGKWIRFDNAFVGNATKAITSLDNGTIEKMYVYGTSSSNSSLFSNQEVTKQGDSWVYSPLVEWETGKTYTFAAYSDANSKINDNVSWSSTEKKLSISDYSVSDEEQNDLVVSIASNANNLQTTNEKVAFTFSHALAKIKFTIKSELGDDNPITITAFKVGVNNDMCTTGNLTFTNSDTPTSTWDTQDKAKGQLGVNFTEAAQTTVPSVSDELVVIPQEIGSLSISFKAKFGEEGEEKDIKGAIESVDWEAGNCYNYTASITGKQMEVIQFGVPTVSDWEPETPGDVTLQ